MEMNDLNKEMLVAMSVAVIAEDMGIDSEQLRVVSFHEVRESPLKRYLKEKDILFNKFTIEVQNHDKI